MGREDARDARFRHNLWRWPAGRGMLHGQRRREVENGFGAEGEKPADPGLNLGRRVARMGLGAYPTASLIFSWGCCGKGAGCWAQCAVRERIRQASKQAAGGQATTAGWCVDGAVLGETAVAAVEAKKRE